MTSTHPSDVDEFMAERLAASKAFVDGNIEPLARLSTTTLPATLFGPQGITVEGAEQVNQANAGAASMLLPGASNGFEVMHQASGDHVAYWVGVQRSVVCLSSRQEPIPIDLHVTKIFRREPKGWMLIHRHADPLAVTRG